MGKTLGNPLTKPKTKVYGHPWDEPLGIDKLEDNIDSNDNVDNIDNNEDGLAIQQRLYLMDWPYNKGLITRPRQRRPRHSRLGQIIAWVFSSYSTL